MNNFWWYLIEFALIQAVLFALYLGVRSWLNNSLKRLVLLTIPVFPFIIFGIRGLLASTGAVYSAEVIELSEIVVLPGQSDANPMNWQYLYYIGLAVFACWSVAKIIRLFYFFRKAVPYINNPSIKILSSELKDSFSFFNRIHLSAHLKEEEKLVVLDHELMHAKKGHSFDLIIYEIYHSFFWYNPLMFWAKKEMIQIHEFEVDQEMYAKYKVDYLGHLVSYALGASSAHLLLTSQFYNKLTLAKRINKMKNKSKSNRSLVAIIPLVAIGLAFISWESPEVKSGTSDPISKSIELGEIDQKPEFKGGQKALFKYIGEEVKYPKEAQKKNISGTVHVQFVVGENGKISNATVKKGAHKLLDAEALRVIKGMPAWNPGKKDGKAVKTEMTLPIKFQLD